MGYFSVEDCTVMAGSLISTPVDVYYIPLRYVRVTVWIDESENDGNMNKINVHIRAPGFG